MLRITRSLAKTYANRKSVPCRRRRAQLRRQWQGFARRFLQAHLDPAGGGRCRRRGRRGARCLSSASWPAAPASNGSMDGMQGVLSRPGILPSGDRASGSTAAGAKFTVLGRGDAARAHLRCAGGGPCRRLVPGPHGVWAARARRPLDPRRSAQSRDAEDAQSQGQVSRELPALRAVGPARGRGRLFRARCRQPLHAAGRRREAQPAPSHDR